MFLVDVVDVVVVWVGEVLFVGVFLLKCNVTGQKWSPRIFGLFSFFSSPFLIGARRLFDGWQGTIRRTNRTERTQSRVEYTFRTGTIATDSFNFYNLGTADTVRVVFTH